MPGTGTEEPGTSRVIPPLPAAGMADYNQCQARIGFGVVGTVPCNLYGCDDPKLRELPLNFNPDSPTYCSCCGLL